MTIETSTLVTPSQFEAIKELVYQAVLRHAAGTNELTRHQALVVLLRLLPEEGEGPIEPHESVVKAAQDATNEVMGTEAAQAAWHEIYRAIFA